MKEQKRTKDFDRMLVEAVQGNFSFFAWQSIGGVVEKCELKVKAYRKDYNEIELEFKPENKAALSKVISGMRMLNLYIPELSVSFTSPLKCVTVDNKVKICPPEDYSFHERRKHDRLQPLKTCFVSFDLNKVMIRKSIFDISIGGMAIILPKSDRIAVSKGKQFAGMVLDIAGRKLKVNAECVNAMVIDRFRLDSLPYGGYKIAFRFTGMSKEDKDFLTEYVVHETLTSGQIKKAD